MRTTLSRKLWSMELDGFSSWTLSEELRQHFWSHWFWQRQNEIALAFVHQEMQLRWFVNNSTQVAVGYANQWNSNVQPFEELCDGKLRNTFLFSHFYFVLHFSNSFSQMHKLICWSLDRTTSIGSASNKQILHSVRIRMLYHLKRNPHYRQLQYCSYNSEVLFNVILIRFRVSDGYYRNYETMLYITSSSSSYQLAGSLRTVAAFVWPFCPSLTHSLSNIYIYIVSHVVWLLRFDQLLLRVLGKDPDRKLGMN